MVSRSPTGYGVYVNILNGMHFCTLSAQNCTGDETSDVSGAKQLLFIPFAGRTKAKANDQARQAVEQFTIKRAKEITKKVMMGQPTRLRSKKKRKVAV